MFSDTSLTSKSSDKSINSDLISLFSFDSLRLFSSRRTIAFSELEINFKFSIALFLSSSRDKVVNSNSALDSFNFSLKFFKAIFSINKFFSVSVNFISFDFKSSLNLLIKILDVINSFSFSERIVFF